VYGTIVVMATLAARSRSRSGRGARSGRVQHGDVLWFAHLYAHGIGESLANARRLGIDDVRRLRAASRGWCWRP
jgi:hypothetical protein